MFRKVFLSMLLLYPIAVWGQLLSVTATLTDSDSTVWVNGNCSVEIYSPNGTAFFGATAIPTGPQACAVDGSGVLTTSIYNTSTITPAGAMYRFTIGSATSAPASQFLTPVTAANMTSTLSALILAPRFSANVAFVYGYVDAEAVATAPGNMYYKTTSTVGQRVWSGSAWTSGSGGGGGTTSCPPTTNILQGNGSAGGCVASVISDSGSTLAVTGRNLNVTGSIQNSLGFVAAQSTVLAPGFSALTLNGLFEDGRTAVSCYADPTQSDHNLYCDVPNLGGFILRVSDGASGSTFVVPLAITRTALTTPSGVLPSIDPAITVAQAVCVKAAGPPLVIGKCSTVVSSSGACTCI